MADPSFDERLRVPLSWWPALIVIVGFGIFEMAAGFTYVVYVPVALFLVGFFIVPLVLSGRARIQVKDGLLIADGKELRLTTVTSVQALDREGVPVATSCREGTCGTCETALLEGEADHRDAFLSDEERAAQETVMICCSRARGDRLVLDL